MDRQNIAVENLYVTISPLRHSLENYLFDPILLATLLSEADIDSFLVDGIKEPSKKIKAALDVSGPIDAKAIREPIEKFFAVALDCLKKKGPQKTCEGEKKVYQEIARYLNGGTGEHGESQQEGDDLPMNVQVNYQNVNNPIQEIEPNTKIKYNAFPIKIPCAYLLVRGHNIEEALLAPQLNKLKDQPKIVQEFKNRINQSIYQGKLSYIPHDLIGLFFDLNNMIRKNLKEPRAKVPFAFQGKPRFFFQLAQKISSDSADGWAQVEAANKNPPKKQRNQKNIRKGRRSGGK